MVPVEIALDCVGEVTGDIYRGVFKIKPRLSHRDLFVVDQYRRELIGKDADDADINTRRVAIVFAKIWGHIVEAPIFWTSTNRGLDLVDETPVKEIYEAILLEEQKYLDKFTKKGEQAVQELKKINEK